jgi:hypothetical protein
VHQVVIRSALLCLAATLCSTAVIAQAATNRGKIAAVNTVLDYRVVWMEDSTPFDPCTVYEAMGRPSNLGAALTRSAQRVVVAGAAPCSGAAQRPSRIVRVDSVTLGDTLGRVFVTVWKGEKRLFETYNLRPISGGSAWGVRNVTQWGALRVYARPSGSVPRK